MTMRKPNLGGLFSTILTSFFLLSVGGCRPVPALPTLSSPSLEPPATNVPTNGALQTPELTSTVPFAPAVGGPAFITDGDIHGAFRYTITSRFGIDLDPSEYPFKDLDVSECEIIGYVSNWSFNGPDSYPIGFEVTKAGSCIIRNGGFQVIIEGEPRPGDT
jgi:hypothetical protein